MKTSYETGRGNLVPKLCDWSKFGGEEFFRSIRSNSLKFNCGSLSITSSSYDSVVCDASTSSPKSGVGLGVETRVGDRIHEYTDVYSILMYTVYSVYHAECRIYIYIFMLYIYIYT